MFSAIKEASGSQEMKEYIKIMKQNIFTRQNRTLFVQLAQWLHKLLSWLQIIPGVLIFNSIQFNIYCIKYSHIYSNTVTKKNHEFSEEVNAK